MLFWRSSQYTINVLYRRSLSPFSCGCYRFPMIGMVSVKENIEVCPCLLVAGLTSQLSDVFAEHRPLWQKGYPFWHHHGVINRLPPCSCELSPLFQLFYQSGKVFCGVAGPRNFYGNIFQVGLVYHSVAVEEILYHSYGRHLSESCQLVHQWGQKYWFHRRDDLLFKSLFNGSVFLKQRLILSELLSSEPLFLVVSHDWRVIARIVRRHKRETRMCRIFLACNCQSEVSVRASSVVQQNGHRIPTD